MSAAETMTRLSHLFACPADELHRAAAEEAAAAAAQRPEAQPETTATGLGTAGSAGSAGSSGAGANAGSAAGSDTPAAAPSAPAPEPSAPAPAPSAPAPAPSAPAPAPSAPKPDSSGFTMVRAAVAAGLSCWKPGTDDCIMHCKHCAWSRFWQALSSMSHTTRTRTQRCPA